MQAKATCHRRWDSRSPRCRPPSSPTPMRRGRRTNWTRKIAYRARDVEHPRLNFHLQVLFVSKITTDLTRGLHFKPIADQIKTWSFSATSFMPQWRCLPFKQSAKAVFGSLLDKPEQRAGLGRIGSVEYTLTINRSANTLLKTLGTRFGGDNSYW